MLFRQIVSIFVDKTVDFVGDWASKMPNSATCQNEHVEISKFTNKLTENYLHC